MALSGNSSRKMFKCALVCARDKASRTMAVTEVAPEAMATLASWNVRGMPIVAEGVFKVSPGVWNHPFGHP